MGILNSANPFSSTAGGRLRGAAGLEIGSRCSRWGVCCTLDLGGEGLRAPGGGFCDGRDCRAALSFPVRALDVVGVENAGEDRTKVELDFAGLASNPSEDGVKFDEGPAPLSAGA